MYLMPCLLTGFFLGGMRIVVWIQAHHSPVNSTAEMLDETK